MSERIKSRPYLDTSDADCKGLVSSIFFPEDMDDPSQTRIAKMICSDCPMCQRCLEWAVVSNEEDGVYGGKTPNERRNIRRHLYRTGKFEALQQKFRVVPS